MKSLLIYPKLTCICVLYVNISMWFLFRNIPNNPNIYDNNVQFSNIPKEPNTFLNDNLLPRSEKMLVNTSDRERNVPPHRAKVNPQPGTYNTKQMQEHRERSISQKIKKKYAHKNATNIEPSVSANLKHQCNMSNYLSLNKQICDTVMGKGNNSVISRIIQRDNSILKDVNLKLLKSFAPSIDFLKDVFKPRDDDCNIDRVSENCDELRKSYAYAKAGVTAQELSFPLAFAMKIHVNANQAHRLLRYIYHEHNVYCIHVDKKSAVEIYNVFKRIEACLDNIIVIEDRISVVYSTIRQVEAEFKCMNALIATKHKWRYYINLTGQEFMLKTNREIVDILQVLNGTNDIESYPLPVNEYHKIRQKTAIMHNYPVITRLRKPDFAHNIEIHKGSAYGMFSRAFVDFALSGDTFAKEFLAWLQDAYAPEELFWATLHTLPGSPGGQGKGDLNRKKYISRAVKWQMDASVECHGKHVHWICIYGLEDIPWLLSNRNIVANKFYEDYEPLALDCVEKELYHILLNGGTSTLFNLNQYRDIMH